MPIARCRMRSRFDPSGLSVAICRRHSALVALMIERGKLYLVSRDNVEVVAPNKFDKVFF